MPSRQIPEELKQSLSCLWKQRSASSVVRFRAGWTKENSLGPFLRFSEKEDWKTESDSESALGFLSGVLTKLLGERRCLKTSYASLAHGLGQLPRQAADVTGSIDPGDVGLLLFVDSYILR